jgi:tRNA dimethylallyltransferase
VSVVDRALRIAQESDRLITIVGPTASGKTALAVALAEKLGGEVVSADSVQIYRRFDVGSGKPTADEIARAPHHLVGALDPLDPIDAAAWAELASRSIAEIRSRGRIPIVCGGTFLWIKALRFGLAEAPAANEAVRDRHRAIAESEGRAGLHERLRAVDAEAAARLHPNDLVRVSRALEVFELSGKTLSAWQRACLRERPSPRAPACHRPRTGRRDRANPRASHVMACPRLDRRGGRPRPRRIRHGACDAECRLRAGEHNDPRWPCARSARGGHRSRDACIRPPAADVAGERRR